MIALRRAPIVENLFVGANDLYRLPALLKPLVCGGHEKCGLWVMWLTHSPPSERDAKLLVSLIATMLSGVTWRAPADVIHASVRAKQPQAGEAEGFLISIYTFPGVG